MMREDAKITELKGIGPKTEALFRKIGVRTAGDLIHYYPRSYDIYEGPVPIGELSPGCVAAVEGVVHGKMQVGGSRNLSVTTGWLKDGTGTLKVVWFRMPFLRNTLKSGLRVVLRGTVTERKGQLLMEQPEVFLPAEAYEKKRDTMQPLYPLTAGLGNALVARSVGQALEMVEMEPDFLPESTIRRYKLMDLETAVKSIHFPQGKELFYRARRRLVFDEFLTFILALRMTKEAAVRVDNSRPMHDVPEIQQFLERLPYELTGAQKKVWHEIREEMTGTRVMSRLVQGDVGSGKTILAFLGLLMSAWNGYQGAMMAPTEVLARQHFETISDMLHQYGLPFRAALLTGSMTAKEKRETYQKIASGEVQIIVGTHALIQEKVAYHDLALVVTDEQHRFGVRQREALAGKGSLPHVLVMSATPIPRTLAMIVYGDLDISIVDELPADRIPIKNCVVDTSYRETAYQFMKKQIAQGRQCYIVCPMVEASEAMEAENVTDYADELASVMGNEIRVQALHGKMKQTEKDRIMKLFADGEIQILVSTTVIEVGINVPNASVMMVENAERFGLAQLHQLRGRVGRGAWQSYCIFMSGSKTKETKKRLEILNRSNDGFYIAEEDLKLRGPGDLFGIRQSGLLDFKIGDVFQDAEVLKEAADEAGRLQSLADWTTQEEYTKLQEHVMSYLTKSGEILTL